MSNPFVQRVRKLRVYPSLNARSSAREAKALQDMLKKNRSVEYLELGADEEAFVDIIRKHHNARKCISSRTMEKNLKTSTKKLNKLYPRLFLPNVLLEYKRVSERAMEIYYAVPGQKVPVFSVSMRQPDSKNGTWVTHSEVQDLEDISDFERLDDMRAWSQTVGLAVNEVVASVNPEKTLKADAAVHVLVLLPPGQEKERSAMATEPTMSVYYAVPGQKLPVFSVALRQHGTGRWLAAREAEGLEDIRTSIDSTTCELGYKMSDYQLESLDTLEEEAAGERRVLKKARLSQMSGALHASEVSVPLDTIRAFQEFVKTSLALGVMDSIETGSELADVTCFFFHARSLDVEHFSESQMSNFFADIGHRYAFTRSLQSGIAAYSSGAPGVFESLVCFTIDREKWLLEWYEWERWFKLEALREYLEHYNPTYLHVQSKLHALDDMQWDALKYVLKNDGELTNRHVEHFCGRFNRGIHENVRGSSTSTCYF
ncbi:hypothetical protein PHYSODRAFT_331101 [Phytophthora sojae]|uniref:Uncharacterized protein n=1 Tax=Phytophthora sojae (strain P6497) TaxID=1094619 RepID=G4ZG17_PHYSP|nr:hypothetical protein PHYSODRAFT_331101 [Phytophthora sojae]EGZ17084.1 hypothetical protein PHYSODRAFT_331101 [Phytophthora sojae]|eukprot:XP_009526142.1 hypothetical protein PHYSODRAFT_331101 [Phytophthora sojae]